MAYTATGTGGNDTLNQSGDTGPGTIVGLAGNDCILTGTGLVTVDGGSGEDTTILQAGNTGTVTSGTENDSIWTGGNVGSMVLFGNEGGDTINVVASTNPQTILGGNDFNDGADCIIGGTANDIISSFEEEYGTGAGWAPGGGPGCAPGGGAGCASAKPIDSQTSPRARVTMRTTAFMIPLKSNLLA